MDAAISILTTSTRLSASARYVSNAISPHAPSCFGVAWRTLLGAYLQRTPSAVQAINHLDRLGGRVHNDHIAMRSFVDSRGCSGLTFLDRAFTSFGYAPQDDIVIPGLPVNARWYEPPAETDWPKVFVSELRTAELPEAAAAIIYSHVDEYYGTEARGGQALSNALGAADGEALAQLLDEPPWRASAVEVAAVRVAEGASRGASEYASWTLTHGHRINHLTILQNVLGLEQTAAGVRDLQSLNALLVGEGFEFNPAGGPDGLTQGSPTLHLQQSSTVADHVRHTFGCGTTGDVPCAFLELIQRHEGFRGFLGQNAKGIFQSTHAR
eukprot:CAMPEP_0119327630 /NCGR_PEP_ID=MMETSP1333-20130426/71280_1 /TAXON_ID=418940 /ORGANISM="Scyphosphaera apsteinii, Strain RCC1455" /LENGTH=324 /DNA_ID=CAMNT_0007336271 /DNA_START=65 /DNA_END=1039 /DNA_ORIENTATION=-